MVRNLVTSVLLYESIKTTTPKAKEAKRFLENLISKSKSDSLSAKRSARAVILDKKAYEKLFSELIPRYSKRNSGFARIIKLGRRIGDNAEIARLELVDKKEFVEKADEKGNDVSIEVKEKGKKASVATDSKGKNDK